nr:lipopolysaccharide assembly protein LapA domain-containing protein [Nocardia vaccinii]
MTSDAASSPDTPPRTSAAPESPAIPEPATGSKPPAVPDTTRPDTTTRPRTRSLGTRVGYAWTSLVAAAIIGIILLIFILQNLNQVKVTLFFWSFSLPLGVTILLSLIAGSLVMSLAGGWRILQLRRAAKRP